MKDHKGCRRAFVWSSKAWYGEILKDEVEEIMFGMYHPEGGSSGEMGMRWKELNHKQVPQLQVFDDAWSALALFTDVIEKLGEKDNENITPDEFIEILLACGFVDDTEYKKPLDQMVWEMGKDKCPFCREGEIVWMYPMNVKNGKNFLECDNCHAMGEFNPPTPTPSPSNDTPDQRRKDDDRHAEQRGLLK